MVTTPGVCSTTVVVLPRVIWPVSNTGVPLTVPTTRWVPVTWLVTSRTAPSGTARTTSVDAGAEGPTSSTVLVEGGTNWHESPDGHAAELADSMRISTLGVKSVRATVGELAAREHPAASEASATARTATGRRMGRVWQVCDPSAVDSWGPERAAELTALCQAALADERLTGDELLAGCWDDPGVVLADPGGAGAVSAVVRRAGDFAVGFVKLVAVHPEARRQGVGRALLEAAAEWVWSQGGTDVHLAGSAPFFLWPGVDTRFTAAHCLVEAAGYTETGAVFDMSVPVGFRHPVPEGIELRRALDERDAEAVDRLVARRWPEWSAEQRRGTEQGTCVGAFDPATGDAVAFACHSVNRAGWFGPTGTDDAWRHRGIGHALLGQVCTDLSVAGFRDVEICWIGPFGFYAAAGGSMSRVFRTYHHPKP